MTRKDKEKVREAIALLMGEECQCIEAVTILGALVGVRPCAADVLEGGSTLLDPRTLAARPNSTFAYKGRP